MLQPSFLQSIFVALLGLSCPPLRAQSIPLDTLISVKQAWIKGRITPEQVMSDRVIVATVLHRPSLRGFTDFSANLIASPPPPGCQERYSQVGLAIANEETHYAISVFHNLSTARLQAVIPAIDARKINARLQKKGVRAALNQYFYQDYYVQMLPLSPQDGQSRYQVTIIDKCDFPIGFDDYDCQR